MKELKLEIEELEQRIAPSPVGGILITPGSGAETYPPEDVILDKPPPIIVFIRKDGEPVLRGFHAH